MGAWRVVSTPAISVPPRASHRRAAVVSSWVSSARRDASHTAQAQIDSQSWAPRPVAVPSSVRAVSVPSSGATARRAHTRHRSIVVISCMTRRRRHRRSPGVMTVTEAPVAGPSAAPL
ncbi:hypothetical protein [Streptomyces sp. DSM 41029]